VIWCLHGFLGRGADWNGLRAAWPADLPSLETPDLFGGSPARGDLAAFGARFAAAVAERDAAPIVLGYSLGGRLALHAVLAHPALWRGAVIISAHLGLDDATARAARRAEDAAWARRFEMDDWQSVLADWNARPVFAGQESRLERPASAYNRRALAVALSDWSLGTQAPLAPRVGALTLPILWIAGARDERHVAQGQLVARHCPSVTLAIAPGTGHRIPWEGPGWFRDRVVEFVRSLRISSCLSHPTSHP
jgi:2-succinyl-6-hydroxy-2,4-cyclohexadiene-1-carboxylate synthase